MITYYSKTDFHQYPIVVHNNFLGIQDYIAHLGNWSKIAIITDDYVAGLYLKELLEVLEVCLSRDRICDFIMKQGENSKNLDTI